MHVGMAAVFQNPGKTQQRPRRLPERAPARGAGRAARVRVGLGRRASLHRLHDVPRRAAVPHVHGGAHTRVQLGSMVVVLPWHDPMRVAEEVSMLDNISGGRLILGLGRGAGKVEFDGFRVDGRVARALRRVRRRCCCAGLEQGYCEFDGEYVKQPRARHPARARSRRSAGARTRPRCRRSRSQIMARLGVGHPDHPAEAVEARWPRSSTRTATVYRQVNGADAPPPISRGLDVLRRGRERAREMARALHRRLLGDRARPLRVRAASTRETKGYEYYGTMPEKSPPTAAQT